VSTYCCLRRENQRYNIDENSPSWTRLSGGLARPQGSRPPPPHGGSRLLSRLVTHRDGALRTTAHGSSSGQARARERGRHRQTIGVHAIKARFGGIHIVCVSIPQAPCLLGARPTWLGAVQCAGRGVHSHAGSTLRRLGIAALPVLDLFFKPWWMEPKLWMSEIVIQIVQYILPLLAVWMIIQWTIGIIFGVLACVHQIARRMDLRTTKFYASISSAPNAPTGLNELQPGSL